MGSNRASITTAIMGLMLLGAGATQITTAAVTGEDVVVRFADLDLATKADAEKLYTRIEFAAQRVCRQVDPVEMQRYEAATRCMQQVMARAVSRISSPQLAAVYAQRAHGSHRAV
jgi:UrcA family protein